MGLTRVLFDDVRVSTDLPARLSVELLPSLAVVDGLEEVRLRVAVHVGVKGGVGGRFVVAACLYPGNNGRASDTLDVRGENRPALARVAGNLKVATSYSVPTQMIWPFLGDSQMV